MPDQGLDPDRLLGKPFFAAFPGLEDAPIAHAMRQASQTSKELAYENFFEPWQRWLAVRVAPTPDCGFAIFSQDITARRLAEQQSKAADERLHLAMEVAEVATWDADLQLQTLHWSDSHFRLLGLEPSPDRLASHELWKSAVHPEDLPGVLAEWNRAKRDKDIFRSEHRFRRADSYDAYFGPS